MGIADIYSNITHFFSREKFPTIKKDTLELVNEQKVILKNEVLPVLEEYTRSLEVLKKAPESMHAKIYKSALKVKNVSELVTQAYAFCKECDKQLPAVENSIKGSLTDGTNNKSITLKQYGYYQLVLDISNVLRLIPLYIYAMIKDDKYTELPGTMDKRLIEEATVFRSIVLTKNYVSSKLSEVGELPDTPVYDYTQDENSIKVAGVKVNNWLGNPIFSFRKWLVDKEVDKINALKEEKQLLELRLLELRNAAEGNNDNPQLRKQIQYYEDKIAGVEAKIVKLEKID